MGHLRPDQASPTMTLLGTPTPLLPRRERHTLPCKATGNSQRLLLEGSCSEKPEGHLTMTKWFQLVFSAGMGFENKQTQDRIDLASHR